jgi:hypothetical protein
MFVKISKVRIGVGVRRVCAAMAALGADAIGEGVSGRTAPPSTTDATAKAA